MDREEVEAYFDGRASGYAGLDWHAGHARELVELAGLAPGERVLDAAAGTGLVALAAARAVGPAGRVVGADISAGMLREAERLLDGAGLSNVTYVKADATRLDGFGTGSFDAVLCCAGMLYLPAGPALAAWHRVLRPGGLLGFSAMRAGFPLVARLFRECAAESGLALTDPMAEVGGEEQSRRALAAAGFALERTVSGTVRLQHGSAADVWRSHAVSPHYPEVASLGADERAAFEARYVSRAEALLAEPGAFDLPVLYVFARKA
ncbi:class I SAM-dependent methyltransferase [Planomonospora venezuelensis]|uniref:Ubiquinone/menaquinone biosynthesis C-methylase UbiE n=1 Tax=Planomonospora venezuelensis TaxID=1999 RepID=A0A841CY86_PLAVE|nr:methyltransferase domain-containing protein [Planomonospora venezuelensis]MBB5961078.1 ubiquinone/menaquinone biosynthesis C-methylase UbiE [Planomonospora venezuelensis]GIN04753.1 methyltransferase [Planomonospora venezuelensis]